MGHAEYEGVPTSEQKSRLLSVCGTFIRRISFTAERFMYLHQFKLALSQKPSTFVHLHK